MKEQLNWPAAALVLCAALPAKAGAGAIRVTAIEVDGPRVVVHGTQKPDFSAFKLSQPARLIVDLSGADVTGAVAPAAVHKDGIGGGSVGQFGEGSPKVGRVVVALDSDARYDVSAKGSDLIVAIGGTGSADEAQKPAARSQIAGDHRGVEEAT